VNTPRARPVTDADPPSLVPYGTWPSPLTPALVARSGLRLSAPAVDGDDIYWIEGRPAEQGRQVLVRWRAGEVAEVAPAGVSVRSRVHEYGGGAYTVRDGATWYVDLADGRVYRAGRDGMPPTPLTSVGPWHHADLMVDAAHGRLLAVREDRTAGVAVATHAIVGVALDGRGVEVLVAGADFYAWPRVSPDGARLCWLAWSHPRMPWEGTELWVADVVTGGGVARARRIAGGDDESIYQPGWAPDGTLVFASDRTGWWTLYEWGDAAPRPVLDDGPEATEFGRPAWTFGSATWAPAAPGQLAVASTHAGRWRLGVVDRAARTLRPLAPTLEPGEWLAATASHAVLVAGAADAPDRIVRVALDDGHVETVRASGATPLETPWVSVAEPVTFPASGGRTAHAFYYPPVNPGCVAPRGEHPPLIVISHGGPTAAAEASFSPRVQFWTTRGFAVVDVNYAGSSGFGRPYRQALDGAWGVADVDDCVAAARWLAEQGRADPARCIIRGGSAGGFTTLAALAFRPGVFAAGASYYGVSDLEALARDTHAFEASYLEGLVGPYPAARDVYRARSPLHAADRLSSPLILFQGLEDAVVPPGQSEHMAAAVRARGLPVAYLAFEGEQHGFRRAETIARCLEAELAFYGAVLGFAPADALPPLAIDNLG
jgi:dipeptidyl aminopeptidase/acylaminoacyl peptidase